MRTARQATDPAAKGYMLEALRLARRGYGTTSPNPMVGAVLVRGGSVIGRGWHHRAGQPHAEIEALRDARRRKHPVQDSTLYVTLEPCSTQGRTAPCTAAIRAAGIRRVVAGATDPNPRHRGQGFRILRRAGIAVEHGLLAQECERLNEAFNHWVVHRTPFVTVKAAMTLDGKIATAAGESRWITGERSRAWAMRLRQGADAILVGINTVLTDNPALTVRSAAGREAPGQRLRRIVLDSFARTPPGSRVVSDALAHLTTVVVGEGAPPRRVEALARQVRVVVAPAASARAAPDSSRRGIDLPWLLRRLGAEDITSLLVEGGGEVNASFLLSGLAHRIAFFYAPMIVGGRDAPKAVAGDGLSSLDDRLELGDLRWRRLGDDWLLTARVRAG